MKISREKMSLRFDLFEPARVEKIQALEESIGVKLPSDFIEFLKISDGGYVNTQDGFFSFWPVSESENFDGTIALNNPDLLVSGGEFLAIGLDDKDELFGFLLSDLEKKPFLSTPTKSEEARVYVLIHEEGEYIIYSNTFKAFVEKLCQSD